MQRCHLLGASNGAHTVPWDGAIGGRIDAILKYTQPREKVLMRNFFKGVSRLDAVVSKCLYLPAPLLLPDLPPTLPFEPLKVILLSRYRDNIHLLLLNVGNDFILGMKMFLSSLLHAIYGINLKWEEHVDGKAVWGEGCLSKNRQLLNNLAKADFPSVHRVTLVLEPH